MAEPSRRAALAGLAAAAAAPALGRGARMIVDVRDEGAVGDGHTLDTAAIQRAIDRAAAHGGRVLIGGKRTYVVGPLRLAGGIDFHVEAGATLRVSSDPAHYAGAPDGVLRADGADRLTISGGGTIDGHARDFMDHYDAVNEWWIPKPFRPRLLVLEDCADLLIRDIRLVDAPSWTIHLIGCRHVLVEGITVNNRKDVPNCDGIDPDHCQHVRIRNCRITCGDDAIVVKTTKGHEQYGASHHVHVSDCVLDTQDSGLKIGTETVQDIHHILFERCRIRGSARGLCIQLRDEGTVSNVTFRQISFVSRYFSLPWWGRGEAISFTAIPRAPGVAVGAIRKVRVERVTGRAENSIRIAGLGGGVVDNVTLDQVDVTFDRWTSYPGGVFDNRPTTAVTALEPHDTPGISIRHAAGVTLRRCTVRWGSDVPASFTSAIEAHDAPGLRIEQFVGTAAHEGMAARIIA
ncbi:MAG: glycoside hydrolase family 28 protein [Sphingomonas sp.]